MKTKITRKRCNRIFVRLFVEQSAVKDSLYNCGIMLEILSESTSINTNCVCSVDKYWNSNITNAANTFGN